MVLIYRKVDFSSDRKYSCTYVYEFICSLELVKHAVKVLVVIFAHILLCRITDQTRLFLTKFWRTFLTRISYGKPVYLGRDMRKTRLPLDIKPTCHQVVLVEWNFVRESLNARYAARETFPSIMISLYYFVIPSSTEFPALTNRYTNVLALIHTCLRDIARAPQR